MSVPIRNTTAVNILDVQTLTDGLPVFVQKDLKEMDLIAQVNEKKYCMLRLCTFGI